jgi:hypothetical protein
VSNVVVLEGAEPESGSAVGAGTWTGSSMAKDDDAGDGDGDMGREKDRGSAPGGR